MSREITIELDAREIMFDEVAQKIGEDALEKEVEKAGKQRLTQIYDNRDEIQPAGQ